MEKKGLKMVILGAPGAGKDTQAGFISQRYKIKMLSMGRVLRDEVKRGSRIGKIVRKDLDSGDLVDDGIVNKLLKERLRKEKNVILDGFPRDLEQAKSFSSVNYALYIDCRKSSVMKRLLLRARIQGRKDDNKATINHRWNVFIQETMPVIEYYRDKGILREVDGNGSIDGVEEVVMGLLQQDKLFQRLLKGK